MTGFGNIADEIIKKAMQEGAFDNLAGKGKPLNLDENPHEGEDWRSAYRILKSNGYTLPWLELRKEIEEAIDAACFEAALAWINSSGQERDAQIKKFRQRIELINQHIFQYNLQAPAPQFHRQMLNVEREIARIQQQASG